MNRLLVALAGIAAAAFWLLAGVNAGSVAQKSTPSVQYIEGGTYEKQRAYSAAVVTQGGRIVWVAGHEAIDELNGKLAGDFLGQARATFANIDATLKSSGGSLQNLVTMTVFIKDPRYRDQLLKLRQEMFPNGKFPASTLITISDFARPDMLIEIQGVAVIGN